MPDHSEMDTAARIALASVGARHVYAQMLRQTAGKRYYAVSIEQITEALSAEEKAVRESLLELATLDLVSVNRRGIGTTTFSLGAVADSV